MEIINFISLLCLTWLFVEGAASVQFIKQLAKVHPDHMGKDLTRQVLTKLFNCALCTGFWVGLFYYQNFILACLVSVAAEIFARLINLLFDKYLNRL